MADRIRFVLDGQVKELKAVDPTLTVLDYLRNVERRCGTKEGCAEGDCGACTVALGEVEDHRLRYRAVNACILFVPALDGKELVTVESLRQERGELHPVQKAMVECHASQCGFCTPGFVMSLFALYESEPPPSRQRINDVLAGNLCRCTGYRPIVAAAERAYAYDASERPSTRVRETVALLEAIARHDTLILEHKGRLLFSPRTVEALAELSGRHPDAYLLAGGTDIGLWVTKQHRRLDTLIYLGGIAELAEVAVDDSHIDIGAAATYSDIHAVLAEHYPDFGELIRRLGGVQVRNVGTIGGNIANASPIGDTPPALIALGARLVLRRDRSRRELPLDEFFLDYRKTALDPGEFIERVRLPVRSPDRHFRAYKVSKRFDHDISAVCGAFSLALEQDRVRDIRICYGGMAETPRRAFACEQALIGQRWTDATVASVLPVMDVDFRPLSDMRAGSAYRRLVARNQLRKFHLETAEGPRPTRLLRPEEMPA
jgi:xanthine dehydrogenase small subunit